MPSPQLFLIHSAHETVILTEGLHIAMNAVEGPNAFTASETARTFGR
jgi:hypothetical protein